MTASLVAAGDPQGGLWYYNDSGMATIHQTTTGEGVTIAVLDSPLNPNTPDLAGLDIPTTGTCAAEDGGPALPSTATDDTAVHATGIVSYIIGTGAGVNGQPGVLGVAPGAKVHHYNVTNDETGCPTAENVRDGTSTLVDAIADGAKIVNMSYWSAAESFDVSAEDIPGALAAGAILVGGTPNRAGADLLPPGAFNGVVSVAAIGPDGAPTAEAAVGEHLGVLAPGEGLRVLTSKGNWTEYGLSVGSSGATAYTSAALALVWSKYPDATSNQILQSLARNTGSEDHELTHDSEHGYGIVNVRHMLEHDPTTYPDENPFLWDDPGEFGPTKEAVLAAAAEPEATGQATTAPDPAATDPASDPAGGSSLPWGVIGAGALALVAVVVVVAVVVRRRPAGPGQA
ncbi:S8 family peptidase [Cellulomonas chitinilytica]|uniref:S8 family peptidase n=1 Tax=Cellulomonas chitinilytica TaxID=398759 RepID=UPI00194521E0|nr:S8 family serine peptidase [Cellulomonas chitinilytica]